MTLPIWFLLFLASVVLVFFAIFVDGEALLLAGTMGIVLSGVYIGLVMGLRRYVYTSVLFIFHLAMYIFTIYIYLNRDLVEPTSIFVFSTFTDQNLHIALVAFTVTLLIIPMPWLAMVRVEKNIFKMSPAQIIIELIGRLNFFNKKRIYLILLTSFSLAVFLCFTNTSVLELPYPDNRRINWMPGEFLKIPTMLATVGILVSYIKYLDQGLKFVFTLNLARVNFLITLIVMLILTGSRGLYTFLWLFVGLFELYLSLKKKSVVIWGLLFILLAWLAYYAWPFLRANLSSMPVEKALLQALGIAFFISTDLSSSMQESIHIQDFAMIGASLFHLLYVSELIENGVSLGGATFINLIPQALPDFLDGILWERPLNDNWLLGNYYYHGGGFLLIANAYWNGGLLVMIVFVLVLSTLFTGFDRYFIRSRTGPLYKFVYLMWLPAMIVQLGYGIQGTVRVIELLAVMILIDKINWRKFLGIRNLR